MILTVITIIFACGIAKVEKNRVVTLAENLLESLHQQIKVVSAYLQQDIHNNQYAGVLLPYKLRDKYNQWVTLLIMNQHACSWFVLTDGVLCVFL
ncbi:hypothetical protein [Pseudoalteromonas luteoviolacea]|uniref:Uncharacterized protein n=1 Tax=Pseudoalteromonas luteoviolacea NCIMB 1942 TaxID=1365253 RepID=A0A162A4U0_9GAMM|nr:hypothetical protein N482_17615 [Pseudoalteromonas luteoviolacea NCIMB 1942]